MKNIVKRIQAMEKAVTAIEAKRKAHAPFVLYRPWSITLDQFYLYYYPEGNFKPPQKFGPLPYREVCDMLNIWPSGMDLQVTMGSCSEWLFAFHYYSEHTKLYTSEQIERFMSRELLNNPELEYMTTENGAEMRRLMLALPQTFMTRVSTLQEAIRSAQ